VTTGFVLNMENCSDLAKFLLEIVMATFDLFDFHSMIIMIDDAFVLCVNFTFTAWLWLALAG